MMAAQENGSTASTLVGASERPVPVEGTTPVAPTPPVLTLAEQLLDASATGMLACDDHGVVRSANAAARHLLPGLHVDEVLPAGIELGTADAELTIDERSIAARHRALPDGWSAWHLDDVTDHRERLDSLLAERSRSRFLATASRRLGLSLHPGRTARSVVELATSGIADTAVVLLAPRRGVSEWYADTGDGTGGDTVTAAGRIALTALPTAVVGAVHGDALDPAQLLPGQLAGLPGVAGDPSAGAVVVTLPGNGVPAGALVLLRHGLDAADASGSTTALVQEFAQRAGIALAAAGLYSQQAGTSAVLRRSLVQPALPTVPGLGFGGAYRAADEALLIGGDFYDVYPHGDSTMFVLGDVCGKGVDAAVTTGQVRQSLQALRRIERDPRRLLELLNDTMLDTVEDDSDPRFASVVLGTARPRPDGSVRLQLAGGGHLPPLVVRHDGEVHDVDIDGTVIGVLSDAPVRTRIVDLAPGEACVLYSDGVTEARGGPAGNAEFGEARLRALLAGCHVMPASAIAERVVQHAMRWVAGSGHDDVAVLVVQAAPAAGRHLHSVGGREESA